LCNICGEGAICQTQNISILKHYERVTALNAFRKGEKTMVTLTAEMKEVFAKNKPYAIATASKNGIPNVAPMSTVQIVADDTIWIGDNYMVKTLTNVRENPYMALYIWDPEKKRCFQIKGTVMVKTSGPDYEKIKAQIKAKGPHYPAKGLLILKITDVFDCTPGPNAGKKVE
jgi:predicted pyridoxine 5'-phosphate oxidase superfamily flavin-nucleotide-binding protein